MEVNAMVLDDTTFINTEAHQIHYDDAAGQNLKILKIEIENFETVLNAEILAIEPAELFKVILIGYYFLLYSSLSM